MTEHIRICRGDKEVHFEMDDELRELMLHRFDDFSVRVLHPAFQQLFQNEFHPEVSHEEKEVR